MWADLFRIAALVCGSLALGATSVVLLVFRFDYEEHLRRHVFYFASAHIVALLGLFVLTYDQIGEPFKPTISPILMVVSLLSLLGHLALFSHLMRKADRSSP